MRITNGALVGISTTTPWRTLSVNGTVGLAGLSSVSTNQSAYLCLSSTNEVVQDSTTCLASSLRFKQNIQPLEATSGLSEVMQLNPVSFQYTPEYNGALQDNPNFNGTFVGFIAEEVAKIDPRLVTVDVTGSTPNAPHGVRYENVTAILTKAVQEIVSISGSFKDALVAWLGNASNGIDQFFAKVGNFQTVDTNQLCVGSTCVTPAQFQAMAAAASQSGQGSVPPPSGGSPDQSSTPTTASTPPVIQINGANPAIIHVGDSYADLGATITGPQADLNLGIHTFVGTTPIDQAVIDTSTTTTYHINYVVTDQNGLTSTSTRTVIIEPVESTPQPTSSTASTTDATTTTP